MVLYFVENYPSQKDTKSEKNYWKRKPRKKWQYSINENRKKLNYKKTQEVIKITKTRKYYFQSMGMISDKLSEYDVI